MSKSTGPAKLKPKIKTDEQFEMTITHRGETFTFTGYVNELEMARDTDEYLSVDGLALNRFPVRTRLTLDIEVLGDLIVQR